MKKTIKVYGQLKKYLGQGTFELDVANASQAIKALCVSKNFSTNVTPFLVLNASTFIISIINLSVN